MKVSLRKTYSHIHVSYADDDYSNNLSATDFCLHTTSDTHKLSINLIGNLNQRDKQANSYADAVAFVEKHELLKMVQIDERKVLEGLLKAHKSNPAAKWVLEVALGSRGTFNYQVKPSRKNDSLFLDVVGV
ncbi:hypothetical protein ACFSJ3_15965 [Corallincola platygyrae]|uniref:Uncharacterized protein n=1 Tax=Corallincola platygyrae TaxID=1193278 RepID=A0ABW4XPJ7_9GAMM